MSMLGLRRAGSWVLAMVAAGQVAAVAANPARAAETEASVEVEVMVPPLQRLDVDPPVLVMPEIRAEEIAAGYAEVSRPIVLTVFSNTLWELSIRSAGDDKAGRADEPIGSPRLQWAVGNGPLQPLTAEWTTVMTGSAPAAKERVELRLRVPLRSAAMKPGIYEPQIEYRLAPAGE
jgi:hypothetical protein